MDKDIASGIVMARVSTLHQGVFNDSIDDQLSQLLFAKQRAEIEYKCEIKTIKTFEFAESASVELDSQPVQKALEYCRNSKIHVKFAFIMCMDRLTRAGSVVYSQLKAEFTRLGVILIDARGVIGTKEINTLESLGLKYKWSVYSPTWVTELLEAEKNKEEVRVSQTRMIGAAIRYVRLGYWRGAIPLGFVAERVDTIEHGRRYNLKPHPIESKWFVRMFELRAEGVKVDEEIVDEVNKIGFITRPKNYRDKEDRSKIIAIKGKRGLTVKMLRKYIQNPIYAGVNTEKWLNYDGKLRPVYLKGEGIISVELFNKANHCKVMIIDEGGQPEVYRGKIADWEHKKLKLNPNFPWKQYVRCPICGHQLKGSFSRGKSGKRFPYYHCHLGHKYWAVSGKSLEETISAFVSNVQFSKKFIFNFENKFMIAWRAKLEQLNRNAIDWNKRINEVREKQSMLESKLKFATTQTGFQVIEEEIEKTKGEIAQATVERSKTEDEEVDIQVIVNAAKYWMEHFQFLLQETQNPFHRALLFGKIFDESPTFEELKNGTPKLSSLFALNQAFNMGQNSLSGVEGIRTLDLLRDREAR